MLSNRIRSAFSAASRIDRDSSPGYQIFMLGLCIYAIGAIATDRLVNLDPDIVTILDYVDVAVCMVFFTDFLLCLYQAKGNRWRYFLTWGWLDLLSSIPTLNSARWGRLARVFRIFRVLRSLRLSQIVASLVLKRRVESTVLASALVVLILTVSCSVAILQFEDAPKSNIKTGGDAIWWAFATITTVGYGDHYPVTTEGRIVASILMIAGLGLSSTVAAFLVAWFVSPSRRMKDQEDGDLQREVAALRASIDRLTNSR